MDTSPSAASRLLEQSARSMSRAQCRVDASRAVAYDAWRAIATSRHRTSRRRAIRGGSADDGLRDAIRSRLAAENLPRIDGRAWVRNSTGTNVCACCGKTISRLEREFEPQAVDGLYAHGPCFTIWLAESVGLRVYERHVDRRRTWT